MLIMALINLSNTPPVESLSVLSAECILKCCSGVCYGASIMCGSLSAAAGVLSATIAVGCLLAAGGGCAACVAVCLSL